MLEGVASRGEFALATPMDSRTDKPGTRCGPVVRANGAQIDAIPDRPAGRWKALGCHGMGLRQARLPGAADGNKARSRGDCHCPIELRLGGWRNATRSRSGSVPTLDPGWSISEPCGERLVAELITLDRRPDSAVVSPGVRAPQALGRLGPTASVRLGASADAAAAVSLRFMVGPCLV